jgi:sodium/hydrogen antiporter
MEYAIWALIIGVLLISMAVTNSTVKRLPLSAAMIYLTVGFAIGPGGMGILRPDLTQHSLLLQRIVEIALLISLFSAGLKLRQPLTDTLWHLSLRLALIGVLISIALITPLALLLGFPFGIALLLAVAIAPTDPVLAADVHVENVADRDRLRFSLTGESSLNDGIALPFIILALQLCATAPHAPDNMLDPLLRWLAIDCVWGMSGGILIGTLCGLLTGRMVLYLRTEQKEALGLDEFLVLGLIAFSYGFATFIHASPFLAVFFAGLSVGHTTGSHKQIPPCSIEKLTELATTPQHAAPLMMRALRSFNEQLESIAEVVIVILAGALLVTMHIGASAIIICAYTFFIARPASVWIALFGANVTTTQRRLMAWFGVRGVGSIYYALFAVNNGLPQQWRNEVLAIILFTCASSIFVHGTSVTPLMNYYRKNSKSRK